MNTREIVTEIYDEMRKNGAQPAEAAAACVNIRAILDHHLEEKVLMPKRLLFHMRDLALGRCPKCAEIRAMIAEAEKS